MRTKKSITVRLTFDWTFDEKDWSENKQHLEKLKEEPKIVLGYDIINTMYTLNDIAYPEAQQFKVISHD